MNLIKSQNPVSLILTSGTLSPLKDLDSELGIPFPIKLENAHAIKDSQVLPLILTHGKSGNQFKFEYHDKKDPQMILDLGCLLLDVCERVRGGIFVFFPSYQLMKDYDEFWEKH
jgi:Rad3-related DNA helicase